MARRVTGVLSLVLVASGVVSSSEPATPGETLLYAVVSKSTFFPEGKTDIFALDMQTRSSKRLFSDAGSSIAVSAGGSRPVLGGGRLFAHAVPTVGNRRATAVGSGALYELALDGSATIGMIARIEASGAPSHLVASADGTRIGYTAREHGQDQWFVHSVQSGATLHRVELTTGFQGCRIDECMWLPWSNRVLFSVPAGQHASPEVAQACAGSYVMTEEGSRVTKLAPVPADPARPPLLGARAIAERQAGDLLYELLQPPRAPAAGGPAWHPRIVELRDGTPPPRELSFGALLSAYGGSRLHYGLSRSGRYLAASQEAAPSNRQPILWIKDLDGGNEWELPAAGCLAASTCSPAVIGWIGPTR